MTYTIYEHFKDKEPVVMDMYTKLLSSLRDFGEVQDVAKKGSIHLDNNTGFCGVYTRKNYLLIHFRLNHQVESPRIEKCEQISKSRFKHTIKLKSKDDIDAELLEWLKDAYELSG